MNDARTAVLVSVAVGFIIAVVSNLLVRTMGRRLSFTEDVVIAAIGSSAEFVVSFMALRLLADNDHDEKKPSSSQ